MSEPLSDGDRNALVGCINELSRVQIAVLREAAENSPGDAIDILAEYFEDAGVDSDEMRLLLDKWWAFRKTGLP